MQGKVRMAATQGSPISRGFLVSAVLVIGLLIALPVAETVVANHPALAMVLTLAVLEILVGIVGAVLLHRRGELVYRPASQLRWASALWLIALCLPWAALIVVSRQAAYLGFVLYFLALWLLPSSIGPAATFGLALLTGFGLSVHHGWSSGAFVGPVSTAAVLIAGMAGLRAIITELSARGELIAALEAAQTRLAESEREAGRHAERTRLGRELHDTVAQHLSSIQLLLHAAERAPEDEVRATHLQEARDAASTALADTRAFIKDLTPAPLAGRSLTTAIERVATEAAARTAMQVTMRVDGAARNLPTATEATVLRIAQEALTNVEKHAQASAVDVRLEYEDHQVSLEVSDDGRGFDSEQVINGSPADSNSFGISGMRARAAELGGYVAVVGEPGEGTLVSAQIPTTPAQPGEAT
ncbi:sensor histidine kinase [Blastococcus sp. Marseille-P5729]|uniref:sensor histidine kinase n=1 Tax=Blastococcus sp. Marseille-P5729 TaxID=2086582 RepID=UPI000D0FE2FF|nr:sensor histidine kinase [Blastococcus sp. Marseille-P5729]